MARVTVIIPAFNPGSYLRQAIASVLSQTYTDYEVVVVDDGSPEDLSYVDTLSQRVRRVRKANGGQSSARNYGIATTDSELIAFIDQDDLWMPEKLRRQVDLLMGRPEMVACHTQFELIDAAGERIGAGYGREQDYRKMLEGTGICGASTVLVRREALRTVGNFERADQPAEDLDLWLRLARLGPFGFVSDALVQYRIHGANQSLQYRQLFGAISRIQRRHRDADPQFRGHAEVGIENYRADAAGKAFEQLRHAVRLRSVSQGLRHLSFVLRHRPRLLAHAVTSRLWRSSKAGA